MDLFKKRKLLAAYTLKKEGKSNVANGKSRTATDLANNYSQLNLSTNN